MKNIPPRFWMPIAFDVCGTCGHFHRPDYNGDCRNDSERFTPEELDAALTPGGWEPIYEDDPRNRHAY